jgi:hypothetical protein
MSAAQNRFKQARSPSGGSVYTIVKSVEVSYGGR